MKITKYGDTPDKEFEDLRREANTNCQTCPCCSKEHIRSIAYRAVNDDCRVDCYRCSQCGAEWESNIYPYRTRSESEKFEDTVFKNALTSLVVSRVGIGDDLSLRIGWESLSTIYRGTITIRKPIGHGLLEYEVNGIPTKYHDTLLKLVWNQLGNMIRPTGSSILQIIQEGEHCSPS